MPEVDEETGYEYLTDEDLEEMEMDETSRESEELSDPDLRGGDSD
jgi:hypothetical protein